MRALLAISPAGLPRIGEDGAAVGVDWRVLGFTLAVSLLTGILFGLFPAFSASRTDLNSSLKESSNRAGTGFRQGKARSLLVISEVSLALVLLVGSALLIRTFVALRGVNPGFDAHNVLTMEMSLTGERFEKTAGVAQLSRDGRERLERASRAWRLRPPPAACRSRAVRTALPDCGAARRAKASMRARMDERLAGLLRRLQDSGAARARLHETRYGRSRRAWCSSMRRWRSNTGPSENPVGQQILIGQGMGAEFEETGAADHRRGGQHARRRPGPALPTR